MNFVTGGTGLVGARLILDLLVAGEEVTAIKRTSSNLDPIRDLFKLEGKAELFSKINWIDGDITNLPGLIEGMKNMNKVFHCAALVSFNPRDKKLLEKVNIEGTANVVNAMLENQIDELYYVSSTSAIGKQKKGVTINEEHNWDPGRKNSNYSFSKYFAELEVWRGAEEGLSVAIVNPGIIVGPGDWDRSSSKVFKTVFNGLKFYSTGSNGFVDVRDVSKALIHLAQHKIFGSRFLLISDNISFKRYFELIAQAVGVEAPSIKANKFLSSLAWRVVWIWSLLTSKEPLITRETAKSAVSHQSYSSEKIEKALNFEFNSVEQAISRTAQVFLKMQ